MAVWLANVDT